MADIKKEFDSLIEQTGWQGENPIVETKPTPEEFFADGTIPLADTIPSPVSGNPLMKVPQSFIKVDGDRTQLTEAQMVGVVGEVLEQTQSIDFFSPSTQVAALQERVYALETFNAKLLLALKQHGFDTVKLFR